MTRAAGAARCPRCDYCKQGPDGYLEIEGPAGLWLHTRCAVDCGLFTAAELVDRARLRLRAWSLEAASGVARGGCRGVAVVSRPQPIPPEWRTARGRTGAQPSIADVVHGLRRTAIAICRRETPRDLLAVAADLEALATAVALVGRRRKRIGR